MKVIGWFSIIFGAFTLIHTLLFPYFLSQEFSRFNMVLTEKILIDVLYGVWILLAATMLFSIGCVISGIIILKRKTIGLTIWKSLCCLAILEATIAFFSNGQRPKDAFIWVVWWGIFGLSLLISKRKSANKYWIEDGRGCGQ